MQQLYGGSLHQQGRKKAPQGKESALSEEKSEREERGAIIIQKRGGQVGKRGASFFIKKKKKNRVSIQRGGVPPRKRKEGCSTV